MRKMGLEPTRCNHHKILSLARLPVPTLPLTFTTQIIFYYRMKQKSISFFKILSKISAKISAETDNAAYIPFSYYMIQ